MEYKHKNKLVKTVLILRLTLSYMFGYFLI